MQKRRRICPRAGMPEIYCQTLRKVLKYKLESRLPGRRQTGGNGSSYDDYDWDDYDYDSWDSGDTDWDSDW